MHFICNFLLAERRYHIDRPQSLWSFINRLLWILNDTPAWVVHFQALVLHVTSSPPMCPHDIAGLVGGWCLVVSLLVDLVEVHSVGLVEGEWSWWRWLLRDHIERKVHWGLADNADLRWLVRKGGLFLFKLLGRSFLEEHGWELLRVV